MNRKDGCPYHHTPSLPTEVVQVCPRELDFSQEVYLVKRWKIERREGPRTLFRIKLVNKDGKLVKNLTEAIDFSGLNCSPQVRSLLEYWFVTHAGAVSTPAQFEHLLYYLSAKEDKKHEMKGEKKDIRWLTSSLPGAEAVYLSTLHQMVLTLLFKNSRDDKIFPKILNTSETKVDELINNLLALHNFVHSTLLATTLSIWRYRVKSGHPGFAPNSYIFKGLDSLPLEFVTRAIAEREEKKIQLLVAELFRILNTLSENLSVEMDPIHSGSIIQALMTEVTNGVVLLSNVDTEEEGAVWNLDEFERVTQVDAAPHLIFREHTQNLTFERSTRSYSYTHEGKSYQFLYEAPDACPMRERARRKSN